MTPPNPTDLEDIAFRIVDEWLLACRLLHQTKENERRNVIHKITQALKAYGEQEYARGRSEPLSIPGFTIGMASNAAFWFQRDGGEEMVLDDESMEKIFKEYL